MSVRSCQLVLANHKRALIKKKRKLAGRSSAALLYFHHVPFFVVLSLCQKVSFISFVFWSVWSSCCRLMLWAAHPKRPFIRRLLQIPLSHYSPFFSDSWAILGRFFTLLDAFFNYNFRLPFYRPSSIDWTWILEGFFGDSSNYSTLFAMFDYQFGSSPSDWTRILEDSLGVLQPLDAVFFFSICSITILGHCSLIRPGFLRILDGSWGLLRDYLGDSSSYSMFICNVWLSFWSHHPLIEPGLLGIPGDLWSFLPCSIGILRDPFLYLAILEDDLSLFELLRQSFHRPSFDDSSSFFCFFLSFLSIITIMIMIIIINIISNVFSWCWAIDEDSLPILAAQEVFGLCCASRLKTLERFLVVLFVLFSNIWPSMGDSL